MLNVHVQLYREIFIAIKMEKRQEQREKKWLCKRQYKKQREVIHLRQISLAIRKQNVYLAGSSSY